MNEQEFSKKTFDDAFEKAYDEKHEEFEEISKKKLIISLLGGVNVGKSKTINALTGIKYAKAKARPGWTKEISLYELKGGVFIADTPGLHDINEEVSSKASEYVEENSDIIMYFLNAAVGVNKPVKDAYLEILKLQKETLLILNKIDTLDGDDEGDDESSLQDMIDHIYEELGAYPIPISAKYGTGIAELSAAIVKVLEDRGKELLFLKVSRYREKSIKKWINGASVTAAGIGALPIPGSDIFPLTALQVGLAMKIAYIYDIKPSKNDVMKLVGSTVTGSVGKQIFKLAITTLKAAGWMGGPPLEIAILAIAASVASSFTYGFGWACNAYYKSGMTMDLGVVGDVFKSKYEEYKKKTEKDK